MSVEKVETLIVGGGQAGLAMSEQLSKRGLSHLVVERHRIAERWRSERWDGLHANGPAWHDGLPGLVIAGVDPDGFATREQMVDYFAADAERIAAPIRCGVAVTALHKKAGGTGFSAETSGARRSHQCGRSHRPFQRSIIRRHAARSRDRAVAFQQIPQSRPVAGGRGAGGRRSSGAQIADASARVGASICPSAAMSGLPDDIAGVTSLVAGRLAVGCHGPHPSMKHVTIAVSGAYGGHTISFRARARDAG